MAHVAKNNPLAVLDNNGNVSTNQTPVGLFATMGIDGILRLPSLAIPAFGYTTQSCPGFLP